MKKYIITYFDSFDNRKVKSKSIPAVSFSDASYQSSNYSIYESDIISIALDLTPVEHIDTTV